MEGSTFFIMSIFFFGERSFQNTPGTAVPMCYVTRKAFAEQHLRPAATTKKALEGQWFACRKVLLRRVLKD